MRMRLPTLAALALALTALAAVPTTTAGCAPVSVKQQIDRADRTAFESLRTFQRVETAAFKAGLPWPTAQQHRDINSKLSRAYLVVVDVANAALALKPGEPAPAQIAESLGQLQKLVDDVVALASVPAAPPDATTKARKAQTDAQALTRAIPGGKQ